MSNIPSDLQYTKEHEWVHVDGNVAIVGITHHAQDSLGEIVYLELPASGDRADKNEPFGVVESTKAVSDLFAPVSGKVVAVNSELIDDPAMINRQPYDDGWMIKIELEDQKDLDDLLSAKEYKTFLAEEH